MAFLKEATAMDPRFKVKVTESEVQYVIMYVTLRRSNPSQLSKKDDELMGVCGEQQTQDGEEHEEEEEEDLVS